MTTNAHEHSGVGVADELLPISNVPGAGEPAGVDITALRAIETDDTMLMLDPGDIVVSEGMNMRRYLPDAKGIDELARDIVQWGQLQPVLVRVDRGKYHLVFGFRRVRAIQYANDNKLYKQPESRHKGPLKVRAQVMVSTDNIGDLELMAANARENLKRQDLNAIDHAFVCQTYLDAGVKKSDISKLLKRAPSWVTEHLALNGLRAGIQKKIAGGSLPYTAIREIVDLPEEEQDAYIKDLESGKTSREAARKKKSKRKVHGEPTTGRASLTAKQARDGFAELSGVGVEEGKESKYSERCQQLGVLLLKFADGKMGLRALASRVDELK